MDNFIIGDVFTGIIGDEILRFFKEIEDAKCEACSNCWINNMCGGICYYYLANKDGTFNPPDSILCDLSRKTYEATMYFMTKYYNEIYKEPKIYLKATRHLC